MAKRPIGKASIKVEVDGLDEAKGKLDGMKSSVEDVSQSGRRGFGKIDESVGKVGKRIEDSTEGLRRFQGALTGIIGVVGGLVAIAVGGFKKIAGEIKEAKDAADAFSGSLRSVRTVGQDAVRSIQEFGETKDALGQLEQQIADQRRAIGEATAQAIADAQKKYEEANPFNPLAEKRARQQLEEDLAKAQADERRQLQRLEEAAAKKRADIARDIEEQKSEEIGRIQDEKEREIAERTRELRLETLSDVERAEEELARKQAELREEIAFTDEDRRVEQLKEILRLETQIGQAKIDAARQQEQDEQNKKLIESNERVIRALEAQAKAINENTQEVRGLRQRVINFTPDIRRGSQALTRRTR